VPINEFAVKVTTLGLPGEEVTEKEQFPLDETVIVVQ
jgi:hypothetical protein